jgi:hypothetical protein
MKIDGIAGPTVVALLSAFAVVAALQACGGAIAGDGRDEGDDVRSSAPCGRANPSCSSGGYGGYGGRGGGYRR